MLGKFLSKIVGSKNDREMKHLQPLVEAVNAQEPSMEAKSDAELAALTPAFKERLAAGETLDDLLPEAFAAVREAGRRTIGQRHYDVQLIGGIVLHQGKIAEMKTGEGKTLSATLPVYLNALTGRGVHVVTVNDYLAKRDAGWMGKIYRFLGLTVGCIVHGLDDDQRQEAYGADVTYGTNNEFGFDYLRDNMKFDLAELVQRDYAYAIVDEVDSILIDEARTPLIISGPAEKSTQLYVQIDRLIPRLSKETHYTIDEKTRTASLTEEGVSRCEELLKVDNLYDPRYMELLHHLTQALKAHTLFKRDVDYIVKDGEVVIVDEFTGRLMPGRRYSEGLHQALEAKEKIKVKSENQTLATITFQNYFRMYDKLAGMTGTADTEAEEFAKIYKLDVVVIPTNREMVRKDHPDSVYRTQVEKYEAAVQEIKALHSKGQPVLVGTVSVERSELLAARLKRLGVPHTVLNAKQHAKEAEIVAQAGRKGAVTISTNMAGRGTDIILGGNPEAMAVKDADPQEDPEAYAQALKKYQAQCADEREQVLAAGGLHILGTERHESRRIDNQLRGRSGRQGDPGSSRFYLSLEDDLLRLFGSDRIKGIMGKLGMEEGEPIEHNLISKAIENAQRKVEGRNFEIRKQLLEYDDVLNKQREVIYAQRRAAMTGEGVHDSVLEMMDEIAEQVVDAYADDHVPAAEWDAKGLSDAVGNAFGFLPDLGEMAEHDAESLIQRVSEQAKSLYDRKGQLYGPETMEQLERWILLDRVDSLWKDHLLNMDHLKEGIGLRGYGQKDPLREYQREGYEMFAQMVERIKSETVGALMRVQIASEEDVQALAPEEDIPLAYSGGDGGAPEPAQREGKKVGRNDPCPCGSGKKYKKCCGLKQ
ncbi:preprotein translocase subunit SecA [Desulfoferula mesophila]|uniref:Protein translocase subunit SecA n=1 Tax=Desulfoferula mesophila TaxID=3058419 RepID=A0AAU9ESW5_9BACT|nr:protein translocase subunit SecA [Desulfoferula mesophilus]